MEPLRQFLEWIRDPRGDKSRLDQQEAHFQNVTSQIVDMRISKHPYRAVHPRCRDKEIEGLKPHDGI